MRLFFSTCLVFGLLLNLSGQDCSIDYVTPQYGVQVERDVFYGVASRFDGTPDSLRMNIFKPVGDGQAERPLLVLIHGGAFVSGQRESFDGLCAYFASRGYVAATISYRLGFMPPDGLDIPFSHDEEEVIRAGFRAIQDAKGAVRFLKARHVQDSSSLENVFVGGASAGAIAALHVGYLDKPSERNPALDSLDAVPQAGDLILRPDLGTIEGDLNLNGFDSQVKGVVSLFGGLFDTLMVESPADPALFQYHQTGDPIVGCDLQRGLWSIPFVSDNYPLLYGSCVIEPRLQNLGFSPARAETYLHDGNAHAVHDPDLINSLMADFLARQICDPLVSTQAVASDADTYRIYPNPTGGRLWVEAAGYTMESFAAIRLFDASGRMVQEWPTPAGEQLELDLSAFPSGMYLLQLAGKEAVYTRRLIKR